MNEWEWQLLEDKSPVESVDDRWRNGSHRGPCEASSAQGRRRARYRFGMVKPPPSKPSSRITKGSSTFASCSTTIPAVTWDCFVSRDIGSSSTSTKLSRCLRKNRRGRRPLKSRVFSSRELATSSWATTRLVLRWHGNSLQRDLPAGVRVADFGIRGFDLAYALQDGYETTILIDAYPHGDAPGTLYVVEPDLASLGAEQMDGGDVDAHAMDPVKILRLAASMGGPLKRVLLVGCEPATLGPGRRADGT